MEERIRVEAMGRSPEIGSFGVCSIELCSNINDLAGGVGWNFVEGSHFPSADAPDLKVAL